MLQYRLVFKGFSMWTCFAVKLLIGAGAQLVGKTWRPSKADSSKLRLILPDDYRNARYPSLWGHGDLVSYNTDHLQNEAAATGPSALRQRRCVPAGLSFYKARTRSSMHMILRSSPSTQQHIFLSRASWARRTHSSASLVCRTLLTSCSRQPHPPGSVPCCLCCFHARASQRLQQPSRRRVQRLQGKKQRQQILSQRGRSQRYWLRSCATSCTGAWWHATLSRLLP